MKNILIKDFLWTLAITLLLIWLKLSGTVRMPWWCAFLFIEIDAVAYVICIILAVIANKSQSKKPEWLSRLDEMKKDKERLEL